MTDHMEIDSSTFAWLLAARSAATEINRLNEIKERAIQHVKDALGDATEARFNGQPVATWTWSKPGQRLDRKKLEGDFGIDVIAGYLIDNQPARPFRLVDTDE